MSDVVTEGNLDNHTDTQTGEADNAAPVLGESASDKEALAAAERGLDPNAVTKPDELLAGKYKDETALNKGVTELLKMQFPDMSVADIYKGLETGKLIPLGTAPDGDKDTSGTPNVEEGNDLKKDSTLDPLDPVALTLERNENEGQLTPETREKLLKEYNIPEATLDTYLTGLNAIEEKFVGQVYDLTGGETQYNTMLEWMNTNVPEEELTAFNEQLGTQDIAKVKLAVEGMSARFKAVAGSTPDLIRPDSGVNQTVTTGSYATKAEWMRDMADSRYKTDEAFREQIVQKLNKSKF